MSPDIQQIAAAQGIAYDQAEDFCRAIFRHFCGQVVPRYAAVAAAVVARPAASAQEIADSLREPQPPEPPDDSLDKCPHGVPYKWRCYICEKGRVNPESLSQCEHGVSITGRCRICKPDDF